MEVSLLKGMEDNVKWRSGVTKVVTDADKDDTESIEHRRHKWRSSIQGAWRGSIVTESVNDGQPVGAQPSLARTDKSLTQDANEADLNLCAKMCRKYNLTHEEVWWKIQEFNEFDRDGSKGLDRAEFQDVIRVYINLPGSGPLPKHLLNWHWVGADSTGDGIIDFEEFLLWSLRTAYTEEVLVPDPQERLLRRIAREHNLPFQDAERLKKAFDICDPNHSGFIEPDEFKMVLFQLLGVKNESDIPEAKFQRWWREVDHNGSGTISFEQFLIWYITNF